MSNNFKGLSLLSLHRSQSFQMFPGLGSFGAVRIALEDFAPGGAVVGKLLRRPIEKEGDAFAGLRSRLFGIQIVLKSAFFLIFGVRHSCAL
jgi:hypothetical protein